jgi:hypothetical protein
MGQSCSPYSVPVMDSGFLFLTGNADTVCFWGLRGHPLRGQVADPVPALVLMYLRPC